jgi:hypothetical protein
MMTGDLSKNFSNNYQNEEEFLRGP